MHLKRIKIPVTLMLICICCILSANAYSQKLQEVSKRLTLKYQYKDSPIVALPLVLKTNFETLPNLYDYVNSIPAMLAAKGYVVASIDSIIEKNDTVLAQLFIGNKYNLVQLNTQYIDKNVLEKVGFIAKNFTNKPINFTEIDILKEKILTVYENQGYPFAAVNLDSILINEDKVSATLFVNKGVDYRIDSIKNYGKLKINPKFLQSYLSVTNGSIYNRDKLKQVDKRMLELPYAQTMQPSSLNMLGSGAILNLYVDNKKSSEASAIFGFLPDANNTGKLQVTGDVNLDLKNVFGAGEGLLFKYQALQPKSPRLNIGYDKPYIFNSAYGLGFLFELFKKDSSFLQVNAQAALQFNVANNQTGKLLFQLQNTNLLLGGIDSNIIKQQKKLPQNVDVNAVNVGINYEYVKTNYKYNPLKGNEITLTAITGIKNIKKSNEIVMLNSPGFDYNSLYDSLKLKNYQVRLKLAAAHYFPLSKTSTFKVALHTGVYLSPTIFRNDVFQIGGYRLLRGFDEESIYATQYAVFTAEYRALLSLNSYLFGFIDAGKTKAKYQTINTNNTFTSAGLGIVYETKAGLLNLSIALGKRNDVNFSLRNASKIHFGYINYF